MGVKTRRRKNSKLKCNREIDEESKKFGTQQCKVGNGERAVAPT